MDARQYWLCICFHASNKAGVFNTCVDQVEAEPNATQQPFSDIFQEKLHSLLD
jgi:hypothetical protein